MCPVADHPQGIVTAFDQHLRILISAPEDKMRPLLHVVAPKLADLRVVQHRASIAQTEHKSLNGGSGQLVHASLTLLFLDGWLVHVNKWMPAVMVEHHPRFVLCGSAAAD